MARNEIARLAALAAVTLTVGAACRGVLGIDDAPAGQSELDGAAPGSETGPDGTGPGDEERDGEANGDGETLDGGSLDSGPRDGGFDGAVREVDLAYPAYPLPPESPPVANYSVDRGAVYDHTTGLEWEQTIAGAQGTWQEASDRCATLALAGKTDWRIPSRSDLISLLDLLKATSGPTVNRVVFPDGASEALWSGAIYAPNDAQAWTVFFSSRNVIWQGRNSTMLRTRCVRGTVEAATKPSHWAVSTNEALDLQTGLVWQRAPGPSVVTFSGALVYCQGLEIGGKRGFRVPTQRELISITDESATSGGVDTRVFSTGPTFRYSTTTASITQPGEQMAVDVGYGGSTFHLLPDALGGVRCVR